LLRNYAANYDGDSGITPKSAAERALWERSVTEGWNRGAKQANLILREGWQLLQRDYLGMILYHTLLREGQVTQPYVSTVQTDIEGTPEEMTVGNTVLRIAAKPELVPNRSDWKGNAGKAPVGYVMPKPAGELKDSEPIKQYNPVYETPPK
jgi:defect-in-organelle-trafficking protein DotC